MTAVLVLFLALHGVIHLLGFAKAFRLADLPQLTQPISPAYGVLWLCAAVLFVVAAAAVALWPRVWWMPAITAVAISTIAIMPSWADAKAGAWANAVVVIAAIVRFLSFHTRAAG